MVHLPALAAPDWEFARSAAGVGVLVDHARSVGVRPAVVLARTGVSVGDLADPEHEVTAGQELQAVRNLLRAAPGTTGAEVGRRYHLSTFGILGYALLSSGTLLEVISLALRFNDLTFLFGQLQVRMEGDRVVGRLTGDTLPPDVREFLLDRDLVAIDVVLQEIVEGGVPTSLDRDTHELAIPAEYLDAAPLQANAATLALCERLCADVASRRRARGATTQQVRVLLTQRLAHDPSMAGVAAALGWSERTLRRRLADEGSTFQELLDEVRASLAARLLRSATLSVEETAQALGYAEASPFIQAFRRWHGTTPARWQRRPASLR
jgi:AraC-like DNA-binding protein